MVRVGEDYTIRQGQGIRFQEKEDSPARTGILRTECCLEKARGGKKEIFETK